MIFLRFFVGAGWFQSGELLGWLQRQAVVSDFLLPTPSCQRRRRRMHANSVCGHAWAGCSLQLAKQSQHLDDWLHAVG